MAKSNMQVIKVRDYDQRKGTDISEIEIYISSKDIQNIITVANNSKSIRYRFSISCKRLYNKLITHVLRYQKENDRIYFVNFYDDIQWDEVYDHFMSHINMMNTSGRKKIFNGRHFHEVFLGKVPTRMFLDLDYKSQEELDTMESLIKNVKEFVGRDVEYVITKNSTNDFKRHVIFTNLILKDIKDCRLLASKFKRFCGVDCQPYHENGSLRSLGSYKEIKQKIVESYTCNKRDIKSALIQVDKSSNYYNLFTQVNLNSSLTDENIKCDLDKLKTRLKKLGFEIGEKREGYNSYSLIRIEEKPCPCCVRIHEKTDTNWFYFTTRKVILKCFRTPDSSHYLCDNDAQNCNSIFRELKNVKPRNYDDIIDSRYENEKPIFYPEILEENDVYYIVSPCKSGKTKMIHEFIETLNPEVSVLFITNLRLFSKNLYDRFKDLGFDLYINSDFDTSHYRQICSLYSLHRIKRDFDYVIIDEVESLLINFNSVSKLGVEENRQYNSQNFIKIINNTQKCILMDAYPSEFTRNVFARFGKSIHISFNDYKTHKDDKIFLFEENNDFIFKLAKSINDGKNIVFASSSKREQQRFMGRIYHILKESYKWTEQDLNGLSQNVEYYSGEVDKKYMHEQIEFINETWDDASLLCFTNVITAGISYENAHFDELYYLGSKSNGSICSLQALYRVRDIKSREYNITFANLLSKNIRTREQIIEDYEYFMNFNVTFNDYCKEKVLANTINNFLLIESSVNKDVDSYNYYRNFIGQLLANASSINYVSKNNEPENEDRDSLEKIWDDVNKEQITLDSKTCKSYFMKLTRNITFHEVDKDNITQLLSDQEFEKLGNNPLKSKDEEDLYLSNLLCKMFPIYKQFVENNDKENTFQYFCNYLRNNNRINEYHRCYTQLHNVIIGTQFNKLLQSGLNDSNDEIGRSRFKLVFVTQVLQRILEENGINCDGTYLPIHNYFHSRDTNLQINIKRLKELMQEEGTKLNVDGKFINQLLKVIYSENKMCVDKTPFTERTDKNVYNIFSNLLGSTYNIRISTKEYRQNKKRCKNYYLSKNLGLF